MVSADQSSRLSFIVTWRKTRLIAGAAFVLVFASLGAAYLLKTKADTAGAVGLQAEAGDLSGPAVAALSDGTDGNGYVTLGTEAVTEPDPSGEQMPVGNLPGWEQIFTDNFTQDAPLGQFPGESFASRWTSYPSDWPDTAGKAEGTNSHYDTPKVVSVADGILTKHLHSEISDGVTSALGAALVPILPNGDSNQLYGRYAVRFRSDKVVGFKTAWLLWPQSEVWPRDGEIDFPEGNLHESISAFMHKQDAAQGNDQDYFGTEAMYDSWHTAIIEWLPDKINFILDGEIIGTSTERIPNSPMRWVLQTETCIGNCQPAPEAEGNLEIDWVVIYKPSPATTNE